MTSQNCLHETRKKCPTAAGTTTSRERRGAGAATDKTDNTRTETAEIITKRRAGSRIIETTGRTTTGGETGAAIVGRAEEGAAGVAVITIAAEAEAVISTHETGITINSVMATPTTATPNKSTAPTNPNQSSPWKLAPSPTKTTSSAPTSANPSTELTGHYSSRSYVMCSTKKSIRRLRQKSISSPK